MRSYDLAIFVSAAIISAAIIWSSLGVVDAIKYYKAGEVECLKRHYDEAIQGG